MLGFGKHRSTRRKTSRSKGENKQQTQPTYGMDARIGTRSHWWEAGALCNAPPLPPPPKKKHSIDMGRAWSQANWELERSPAPIGIVKPHFPSLPCLYPSAPVLGSPKGVATVIVNSMFPHSYFITKMFVRHARILKHLLFRRMYQAIVSPYKFFDFHFPGTGQVSRKRNLCGNRRAETGLIQHCAGHRTSL